MDILDIVNLILFGVICLAPFYLWYTDEKAVRNIPQKLGVIFFAILFTLFLVTVVIKVNIPGGDN